ncbi:MAG: hypothetical protein H0T73_04520 [Ardenticatenales bacterium]|nr:hypothetical protein [Ardenticatenales bacterium]
MNIHDLLNKMESAEEGFLNTEFLAPVLPGRQVQVRIAGMSCTLRVVGEAELGWAILKPLALDRARIVGKASLQQVREFLELFPAVRLLLLARAGADWLALPAQRGDRRFRFEGPVRVHFAAGVEPFQQIIARFDGRHCWFQEIDRRRTPAIAAYLRDSFANETAPETLHKPTLTAEEREVYSVAYRAVELAKRDRVELRLADALEHAGATLTSYIEREDGYTVAFMVDGRPYRSTVHKNDLTVLVAGICLAGQDRRFDLQSLVGVLREGEQRDYLVSVGDDGSLDEETYWQVHPPEE